MACYGDSFTCFTLWNVRSFIWISLQMMILTVLGVLHLKVIHVLSTFRWYEPSTYWLCSAVERKVEIWTILSEGKKSKKSEWPESASHLSTTLVPTFADRRCHVVSLTDHYGRMVGFLDRSRHFFFQVTPQLYSRGWVVLVPDPLLLRKTGRARNRTKTSGSIARNSDH
jgi:hypothetical protein